MNPIITDLIEQLETMKLRYAYTIAHEAQLTHDERDTIDATVRILKEGV